MTQVFHRFPALPKELRDHIWDLAARPVPGTRHAHSFLIVDHYFNEEESSRGGRAIDGDVVRIGNSDCQFKLAVPHGANDSAYLTNAALWMVCGESRAAMERRFPRNEWWSPRTPMMNHPRRRAEAGDLFGQEDVAHSAYYTDLQGDTKYITINYDDLIYFEGHNPDSEEWYLHYAGDKYLLDRRDGVPPEPSFIGVDVAIDLKKDWLESSWIRSSLIDFLCSVCRDSLRHVWFVDHRLERDHKRTLSAEEESRLRFYSDGRVFTEVLPEDISGDSPMWTFAGDTIRDSVSAKPETGFGFLDRIEIEEGDRLTCDHCEEKTTDRMKILACEYRK